jgi:hypothetical protein
MKFYVQLWATPPFFNMHEHNLASLFHHSLFILVLILVKTSIKDL